MSVTGCVHGGESEASSLGIVMRTDHECATTRRNALYLKRIEPPRIPSVVKDHRSPSQVSVKAPPPIPSALDASLHRN